MAARRGSLALCALAGLGLTLLLAPVIAGEMGEGLQAARAATSEATEATGGYRPKRPDLVGRGAGPDPGVRARDRCGAAADRRAATRPPSGPRERSA
jgi:hypothetical protein